MKRNTFLFLIGFVIASGVGLDCIGLQSSNLSADEPQSAVAAKTTEVADPPVIGIASLTSSTYVRAIRESGGIPVVLPNTDGSSEAIAEYLELLDGLVMPGGPDIPPVEYGEEKHPTANLLDADRYQFEKAMITAWITKTDKPLLGICLGSQWVNVAHGGSLVQDIPSEFGVNHRGVSHQVKLESDSRLAKIFGSTQFEVNSFHHQAVRRVGKGLRIVAKSPDGIVEATESTDPNRFLIGVQWHPEKLMPENKLQAKLLEAFIDACAEKAAKPELAANREVIGAVK